MKLVLIKHLLNIIIHTSVTRKNSLHEGSPVLLLKQILGDLHVNCSRISSCSTRCHLPGSTAAPCHPHLFHHTDYPVQHFYIMLISLVINRFLLANIIVYYFVSGCSWYVIILPDWLFKDAPYYFVSSCTGDNYPPWYIQGRSWQFNVLLFLPILS